MCARARARERASSRRVASFAARRRPEPRTAPRAMSRDARARREPGRRARETYARDDVACGSAECARHRALNLARGCAAALASADDGARCYVVPDAAAWRAHGDVFSDPRCARDVIALRSTRVGRGGRRARGTARGGTARGGAFVFDDEHCAEIARATSGDGAFASREVAVAAYYAEKVRGKFPVVVASDALAGRANANANANANVEVLSVEAFIDAYCDGEGREIAREAYEAAVAADGADAEDAGGNAGAGTSYDAHRSEGEIAEGAAAGTIVLGALRVQRLGAVCEGFVDGVLIPSKHAMNRAIHGDSVAVEICPEDEWRAATATSVTLEDGDQTTTTSKVRTGRVVGITHRATLDVVACLDVVDEEDLKSDARGERNGALCVPMDSKIVKVKLLTRRARDLVGQRFIVRIDRWLANQRYPSGHLVKILGGVGEVDGEMAALLARYDIPAEPFGARALAELPREGADWMVPKEEIEKRRDLRHHRACSIDPPGCTDVDDALSVHVSADRVEIGVHIADVSYFVRPGTLLDHEAQMRGTTVYLVDRRLDMLPSLLSENLASLLERRDRLAVSCVWTLDRNLDVVDVWLGRTVIHSRHQMTYYQAQAIHDGQPLPHGDSSDTFDAVERELVRGDLQTLVAFANKTNAIRLAHGAVELESAELRFETDAQTKTPTEVLQKDEVPMMRVVAELMILANSAAARTTHRAFPSRALLRRHAPPREGGFEELTKLAAAKGIELDGSSGEALNASLARVAATSEPEVTTLFRGLATRAMSEAQYISSGSISGADGGFGHYGLALTYYTHFTSPIRRYADVVVHRQLIAAVDVAEAEKRATERDLDSLAQHLNERNRASKHAQSRCGEIYLLWLLREKPMIEPAVVHEIRDDGVMVFLPAFHMKAPIRLVDDAGNAIEELKESTFETRDPDDKDAKQWLQATPVVGVAGETLRRSTSVEGDSLNVVRSSDDTVVRSYALLQKVWVQMSCTQTRTHGPKLELRLLDAGAHAGARDARIAREREPRAFKPTTLSTAVKQVIADIGSFPVDADADENDDRRHAVENLNVPAKSASGRSRLAPPLARLTLNDDTRATPALGVITVDEGPDETLRVERVHAKRRAFDARRAAAARAWARLHATRALGDAGRARHRKRARRVAAALDALD